MNSNGIGLGLTIVKQIVESAQGVVEVRSEGLNRGTTVCLSMKMREFFDCQFEESVDTNKQESRRIPITMNINTLECQQQQQQSQLLMPMPIRSTGIKDLVLEEEAKALQLRQIGREDNFDIFNSSQMQLLAKYESNYMRGDITYPSSIQPVGVTSS